MLIMEVKADVLQNVVTVVSIYGLMMLLHNRKAKELVKLWECQFNVLSQHMLRDC